MPKNQNNPRTLRSVSLAPTKLPCSKCKEIKTVDYFRIRTDKRIKKQYYNSNCRKCEGEIATEYYKKNKVKPEFKKKNVERVREYAKKNIDQIKSRRSTEEWRKKKAGWELDRYYRKRDEINEKQREKRKTPEYKEKMKAYRLKNKEKIQAQEVVTKKRYQDKHKTRLTDRYIVNLLRTQGYGTPEELFANKDLIGIKRTKVLIVRINKLIKTLSK